MGLTRYISKSVSIAAMAFFVMSEAATVNNPILYIDSPDPSIVRVDDAYYMVTTTMHFAPGVPVFKSTNLAQWRTVGYAYETLTNNDEMNLNGGKNAYGKGSWASSIRYRKSDGHFYVLTPSYTSNKTHLYKTKDIENGPWSEVLLPFYHDPSLFFDDDGSAWVFYGGGNKISYVQLNDDASGVKAGGRSGEIGGVRVDDVIKTSNYYVQQEGSHMEKVNGEYYLFTISWPAGSCRSEIVYRSKSLLEGFSGRIFLQDNGVAQGGIFDTPDGKWYALLFRDSGPVGRMTHLVPMVWKDGWPEPEGGTKKAPATLELSDTPNPGYDMVTSDDFDSDVLALEWQWNHNPDNKNWSLSANPGYLRITTSRTDANVANAKNTLTQRTFGPKCSGRVLVDGTGMKDGDIAGLVALQDTKGFVGIEKKGDGYNVVMKSGKKDAADTQVESKSISSAKVYLRVDFDLPIDRGSASFYYSENGESWTKIGDNIGLDYSLGMFVGYRFGLFNFATKTAGGYADFDWFKIGTNEKDEIYMESNQDTTPPTPYKDVRAVIPGKIEAENYDVGKPNRAYYDNDGVNEGKVYREDGVDIVAIDSIDPSKGYAIGYTADGEWLKYSVDVKTTSEYTVFVNMATSAEDVGIQLYIDDKLITDKIVATQGEDWSNYVVVTANTTEITAGEHVLKMVVNGNFVNIDYIEFVAGKDAKPNEPQNFVQNKIRLDVFKIQLYNIYDLRGKKLGSLNLNRANATRILRNAGYKPNLYVLRENHGKSSFIVNTTK